LLLRKQVCFITISSNFDIPVYALSEEDIVNYIESCPENSKVSKKKKRKEKNKIEHTKIQRTIPLLKGFERNFITPDSSADRTTATPHSINNESALKEIKKVCGKLME
jgi:hypothetical protein